MRKLLVLALVFTGSVGCTGPAAVRPPSANLHSVWLKNARVVDPVSRTVQVRDVFIRGNRIEAAFGAGVVADETLDLSGKWIIPGLVDLHVHSWGNPSPRVSVGKED